MRRLVFLAALLTLSACNFLFPSAPPPPLSLALGASVTQGEIPLTVTFTAATSAADSFRWAIGGAVQEETTSTFTTTFDSSGLYVVTVSAITGSAVSASESVTVKAIAPDLPNTGPVPAELSLTATPGGPAPWGVRYTVAADVDLEPSRPGLEARCGEGRAYQQVYSGSFACVHDAADTVEVRFVGADGEITARAEATPDVTENEGVAFAGHWRYSSRGTTETFEITEGDEAAGSSADDRFKLFTIKQREGLVVEFTIDGRTVVLTPVPEDDGRQVFFAEVYGLVLEPLADSPEEGMGRRQLSRL